MSSSVSADGPIAIHVQTVFDSLVPFTPIHSTGVLVERPETIHLEAAPVGRSWRSTLERALFECAMRIDLAGSAERLAEALGASITEIDSAKISRLAGVFGSRGQAAERRLVSMARSLDLPLDLDPDVSRRSPVIGLDPRDDRVQWTDSDLRVAWNTTADELRAVVRN